MFRKILYTVAFLFSFASLSMAQSGGIEGTVTDTKTGDTIPGANVLLTEANRGSATNAQGAYSIENVQPGTYSMRVTFVGYKTFKEEVTISANETLQKNVQITPSAVGLDEVVVTGYGEYSKRDFTGSVSQVSSEELDQAPVTSVGQALEGNVAGANISASTGTPGAVQQINIRGISSINAGTQPLYVIDGVPVVSGNFASSDATSSLGVLSSLSNSDIKSVSVLKDASATAPYGARGSNGVIVIETKSGSDSDVTYSVDVQRGFSDRAVDGPGTLTAKQWDQFYYDAAGNLTQQLGYPGDRSTVDALLGPSGWDGETSTDWGDVVTQDHSVQQQYSLSARGGNDRTTFYVSGSYTGQEGQVIGSDLNRYSGKVNISHQLDDWITVENNLTGSFVKQNGVLEGAGYFGSPVLAEYFTNPIDKAYNSDGTPNTNLSGSTFNPVYIQNNDISRKNNSRLINNTNVKVDILDNLSFKTNFAIDYLMSEEKYYRNPYYGDADGDIQGSVNDIDNRNFNYVWRNTIRYKYQLDDKNAFDIRVVSETQKNRTRNIDAYGEGIASDGLVNLNTTTVPQGAGSYTTEWGIQSFTGLVNYNFDDKFLLDLSLREEGNSRFTEDERWGTFWSAGAGYILTEEEFLQDTEWLSFLKLRASYGKTGNASIGINNYQTFVGFGGYNGNPSISPVQLGNPNLTWEKAYALDLALDFEVFNRVEGSFTYFNKKSQDLLFDVPLSRTTSHNSQIQNSGDVVNRGIELTLNADIIRTDDFAWNLGGNFAFNHNEVTSLPKDPNGENIEITTGTRYRAVEGYSINSWYMKEWAGVDPANGDPLWYKNDGNGGKTTTNVYTDADRYFQGGNAQPNKYGAINTRIDLFGFYAKANFSFAFGHKIYDNWARYMLSDGAYAGAFGAYAAQSEYWQEPGDEVANPKPILGGNGNSTETSTRYLYDGDNVRLKSLNIGYHLPAQLLENVGLKSATVYFNGRNLWTHVFDDDLKYDPEQKNSGFTDLSAQPLKTLTFGIKANF